MCTGLSALDSHDSFPRDFTNTLRQKLWTAASRHHAGGGLEEGADCSSHKALIQQLSAAPAIGHRLGE
eukprot:8008090-Pyramimonas_sp.AAC.1